MLAIGLIVLLVVGGEIVQGEAIVARHEVNAADRHAALHRIDVGAAGKPFPVSALASRKAALRLRLWSRSPCALRLDPLVHAHFDEEMCPGHMVTQRRDP